MTSDAKTVKEYLASLPTDRRAAISAVRKVILENLPKGYEEYVQSGMISYVVPHSVYPAGYHCNPSQPMPFASLASQKNHMALHLFAVYSNAEMEQWLRDAFEKSGKKIDLGKACLRFKKLEDLPLDVIGKFFARIPVKDFLARIEAVLGQAKSRRAKK
jgi:hypothetical protein